MKNYYWAFFIGKDHFLAILDSEEKDAAMSTSYQLALQGDGWLMIPKSATETSFVNLNIIPLVTRCIRDAVEEPTASDSVSADANTTG
jgi:hypothetical protein